MSKEVFEKQKFNYEDLIEAVKYGVNYGGSEEDEKINVPEGNILQWLQATKTRTADEWQKLTPDILVIDPDGFDRKSKGWKKSWYEEQLTYQEYVIKRDNSTCINKTKDNENLAH